MALPRVEPLILDPTEAKQGLLAVGGTTDCAVTPGGEMACWKPGEPARMLPRLSNIATSVAGLGFLCALDDTGRVFCRDEAPPEDGRGPRADATDREVPLELSRAPEDVVAMSASGDVLCMRTRQGATRCRRGLTDDLSTRAGTVALTADGCSLMATGTVRCDWAFLGENRQRPLGSAVLRGPFVALVQGGYNPGYEGIQHCALTRAGEVQCCTSRTECKDAPLVSRKLPRRAVQLQGTLGLVCVRTEDGEVYCWTPTVMEGGLPFATTLPRVADSGPFGNSTPMRVRALSNVVEIAAGWHRLCARLRTGQVACVGEGYGEPTVVQRAMP